MAELTLYKILNLIEKKFFVDLFITSKLVKRNGKDERDYK